MMKHAYDLHTVHNTIQQKKKTMYTNYTATISINYSTLVTQDRDGIDREQNSRPHDMTVDSVTFKVCEKLVTQRYN